jgi:hypothetical protein
MTWVYLKVLTPLLTLSFLASGHEFGDPESLFD